MKLILNSLKFIAQAIGSILLLFTLGLSLFVFPKSCVVQLEDIPPNQTFSQSVVLDSIPTNTTFEFLPKNKFRFTSSQPLRRQIIEGSYHGFKSKHLFGNNYLNHNTNTIFQSYDGFTPYELSFEIDNIDGNISLFDEGFFTKENPHIVFLNNEYFLFGGSHFQKR